MTPKEYLDSVLKNQTLPPDGAELNGLQEHREKVEALLMDSFKDVKPTIRYGGSKAKGTMIKEGYDLDIICYFDHDSSGAGDTLKDIFNNVKAALEKEYEVYPKTSALRLRSKEEQTRGIDFHIDVVPGRFTDDKKEDAFLHMSSGEKERLKTNIQKHIDHIKESGCTEAIRLIKFWNIRNGVSVKTFVLELLVVKLLSESKNPADLPEALKTFWTYLKDHAGQLGVEDPANPTGNNLSELLNDLVKARLQMWATNTLNAIESSGWESVFGPVEEPTKSARVASITASAANIRNPAKPWLPK